MKKKILSIILAVIMIVGMLPFGAVSAFADGGQEPIEYEVCVDGVNQVWETRYCTEYTVINENNKPDKWMGGWYVCEGADYSVDDGDNRIDAVGDVHLIMRKGAKLTVDNGINISGKNTLSFYQEKGCTLDEVPRVKLQNLNEEDCSPLGADDGKTAGTVNIYGSVIEARSKYGPAAVGGGTGVFDDGDGGIITVYGGGLSATSTSFGAGIGGGGGSTSAGNGGSLTVYGGDVYGESAKGAGIGGGAVNSGLPTEGGDGANVTVYGGEVQAFSLENGAGIGGGDCGGDGGSFSMYGGKLLAESGGNGAGIGGGEDGDALNSDDDVFGLYGGILEARSLGNGPAIGPGAGGDDEDGTIILGTDSAWVEEFTNTKFGFADDRTAIFAQKKVRFVIDSARFPVYYQTVSEDRVIENKICRDYKCVYFDDPTWDDGWYILDGVGTTLYPVTVTGDVHLILMNGCDATVTGGIKIAKGSTLTVHQQPQESGVPTGKLKATGQIDPLGVLGFNPTGIYGSLIMCGGDITARGISGAAGYSGDLTLYGGNLNAYGGDGSVAIGGGYEIWGGDLKFYRGTVTAVAGAGASRAIGVESGSSTDCSIILGESTTLLDSATGQPLKRTVGAFSWNDVLSGSTVSFAAISETPYREYSSDISYFDTKTCLEYTILSDEITSWNDGWYVLNQNITVNNPITVNGEVNLILQDDTTLNLNGGINIADGSSLTVFAQSEGSHKGKLNVGSASGAAVNGGSLTVSGGKITLTGGEGFAAIGNTGRMIVNGGSITATAGAGADNAIDCSVLVGGQYALLDSATGNPIELSGGAQSWAEALSGSSVSFDTAVKETYLEYSADGKTCEEKEIVNYQLIDARTSTLNTGFYLASGSLKSDSALTVTGDAKLILANGCRLTVDGGICVNEGNSLTVFAQSEGDKAGRLIANGTERCAGIGGGLDYSSGNITIHGGNITANGGNAANGVGAGGGAGIGGGNGGDSSPVVIYGGNITANGGTFSAGIGGGYGGWCGDVTIYGGTVKAVGGFNDVDYGGAGIGGGATNSDNFYSGGCDNVTVYGGNVEAIGGKGAAGIGGGHAGSIFAGFSIYGGTVEATGGRFATGLGNGADCLDSEDGNINICGGTLIARSGLSYSRVMGYSDGAPHDGAVYIADDLTLINKADNNPITRNPGQSWLDAINAAATGSSGHYVITIFTLGGAVELLPTCTENGHKAYYYNPGSELYYEDAGYQTEIGNLADLLNWLEDENGGLLPATGHIDENGDFFCDVCHTNVCEHARCTVSYIWNRTFTKCTAIRRCLVCEKDILTQNASEITFTDDYIAEICTDMGYGHYTATFADFDPRDSRSVDTEPGDHHYIDFVCEHCHRELLEQAKVKKLQEIDEVASGDLTLLEKMVVAGAKVLVNSAKSVAELNEIRDECIAQLGKHEHTFEDAYTFNATHHWYESTCGHEDAVSGFGAHTFDENGKCTVCGYEKTGSGVKICTVTLASVDNPDKILYSGTTDENGLCNIGNVANGKYLMSVSCEGAVTRTYNTEVVNGTVTQEVALYEEGDVNGDGEITVEDYSVAVNTALGSETEVSKDLSEKNDYQKAVADLDGDGYVDVLDVSLLERKIHV